MKKIGILFGQERGFPLALADRIKQLGRDRVEAEPAKLGGASLEMPKTYDLILDRISQDIPVEELFVGGPPERVVDDDRAVDGEFRQPDTASRRE